MKKNRRRVLVLLMIFFVSFVSIQNLYFENGFSKLDRVLRMSQTENIELISESELATRWDFINETAGYDIVYGETFEIGYDNWSLSGVESEIFEKTGVESVDYLLDNYTLSDNYGYSGISWDTSVQSNAPFGITWDGTNFFIVDTSDDEVYKYTAAGAYVSSWDTSGQTGAPVGITWDGTNFFIVDTSDDEVYKYTAAGAYVSSWDTSGQSGDPYGITWDGTNFFIVDTSDEEVYKYTAAGAYVSSWDTSVQSGDPVGITWDGTNFFIVDTSDDEVYKYTAAGAYVSSWDTSGQTSNPYEITWDGTNFFVSDVGYDQVFKYSYSYDISKIYNGDGYIYMQTNETETLKIRSSNSLDLDLQIGDKIEITFNTSSTNRIDFNLRNNSIQQKSYILSGQGNGNFNDQIKTFTITSNVSVDQFEFTGIFDDTKNLIVKNINISRPYSETLRYYLAPYGYRQLDLGYSHNYTVEVYENDEMMESWSITTSETLQTLVYERIDYDVSYITFYDSNNEYLQFVNFITYANYTLNNFTYIDNRLSNHIIYTDKDSVIYFNIYDSFEVLVKTFETYEETFIDITLPVYSLKIKNEKLVPVEYELKNNDTAITKSGYLFENEILEYNIATGTYIFEYLKEGESTWENFTFSFTSNRIFILNRSRLCFLSYTNQRGEYLSFNLYKTYVDEILLYENIFYRETGVNVSVEIKDHFDISVKNHSFIVSSEDNYVPVILTMYSLKVMNQQETFNHINITRDPNYYESPYYWSEWIAPNEIIKFNLFAGYYKINLTDNEGGSSSYYSYTLNGDDILLISSDNIISQVIYNIENVNTTIGNLITNVEINITNQNSEINNTIVNIVINLDNVNSTLGNLLISQGIQISNIENNISSLYVFTNNSFINLNNVMNTSFIYMENNIISINQSISNLVVGVSNDIYLINGTISTMISQLETNLLLMNVSIDTSLFNLGTTLNLIGSNITSNYILLNNSITLTNTNINDSRIAIINNLLLINNTISDLISQVYSSVYLINNSIYNAVFDLGTSLSLINNSISGNISIVLQQNDFLTEIYKMTMFSELLNWTNIGLNTSLLTAQIDVWEFINDYRNESIQVLLEYQDIIDTLIISAQNTIEQYLPSEDVEYRLKSVDTGEYLSDWEPLPENGTVDFGFYSEEVPYYPSFNNTSITIVLIILIFIGIISLPTYFVYKYNKRVQRLKRAYAKQHTVDKDLIEGAVRPRSSRMNRIK